ncbi:MAG: hypothetical protein HY691_06765 [Chloroflexi bacterium]|nr:hypothetical protein [Chloroflexota bacterium]
MNRLYYARGWTDGLPIVPPTEERVQEALDAAGADPEEVVGIVPPKRGEATMENVAINCVMAGCLPQYFPVVVSALRAMLEPQFNLFGIQATTHPVAPLVIVNGPLARDLDVNASYGCFGPGARANATIGRALRLIMTNVGGALPGKLDRATQGQPSKYAFCIAENEDESPWEPLHVERGYTAEDSTVTVIGVESPHNINDHVSQSAVGVLATCADTMAVMGSNPTYLGPSNCVLVLGPEHAATVARDRFRKADVKRFLYEHARKPLRQLRRGGMYGMQDWPSWWETASDDALLPLLRDPDDLLIVVAGGAGKHSAWLPSFGANFAVTRLVGLR